jgi:hypothetical protein
VMWSPPVHGRSSPSAGGSRPRDHGEPGQRQRPRPRAADHEQRPVDRLAVGGRGPVGDDGVGGEPGDRCPTGSARRAPRARRRGRRCRGPSASRRIRPSDVARDSVAGLATSPKKTDPDAVGHGVEGERAISRASSSSSCDLVYGSERPEKPSNGNKRRQSATHRKRAFPETRLSDRCPPPEQTRPGGEAGAGMRAGMQVLRGLELAVLSGALLVLAWPAARVRWRLAGPGGRGADARGPTPRPADPPGRTRYRP